MNNDQVTRMCTQLIEHIKNGDVQNAGKISLNLANLKPTLKILPEKHVANDQKWTSLTNVTVEDSENQTTIQYHMNNSASVRQLKQKFEKDFKIPVSDQVWIVNGSVPNDGEIISEFKKINGHSFYLYITDSLSGIRRSQEVTKPKINEKKHKTFKTQEPVKLNKWTCKCTYKNEPNTRYCNDCGSRRPGGNDPPKKKEGWKCAECSGFNFPLRRVCELCGNSRPDDYKIRENYKPSDPKEIEIFQREKEAEDAFLNLLKSEKEQEEKLREDAFKIWTKKIARSLVENEEAFECPICITGVEPGEGIQLRNCTHQFCKECLKLHINSINTGVINCPSNEGYECEGEITDMEIRALITEEENEVLLRRRRNNALGMLNAYRCKTVDCEGACEVEDEVNLFKCIICKKTNCLTCKAIHEAQTCKEYQDELALKALHDENAKKDKEALDAMIATGEAIYCPGCRIIVIKKDGCDWIKCTMCKIEICWATKGPRWGPGGAGDVTGGCRCRAVGNQLCTPNCRNCH